MEKCRCRSHHTVVARSSRWDRAFLSIDGSKPRTCRTNLSLCLSQSPSPCVSLDCDVDPKGGDPEDRRDLGTIVSPLPGRTQRTIARRGMCHSRPSTHPRPRRATSHSSMPPLSRPSRTSEKPLSIPLRHRSLSPGRVRSACAVVSFVHRRTTTTCKAAAQARRELRHCDRLKRRRSFA